MKLSLFALFISSSLSAATIRCRAPDGAGDLHLFLDSEARTFSFAQFCWNPCNMGEGKIVSDPLMGWSGIRYRIELKEEGQLISPFEQRTLHLLFDFDMGRATMSDRNHRMELTCNEGE